MKTFQRFLDSLPPRFSDLEQLPQNFLTAWQWFDQQEKKLPHGYEDASAAVKAIIISMALAALNGKKVRFSDFKQWRWNKDINDKFYQMKNNLNANREKGLIASTSAWLIVSQNMLTIAENLIPTNPAQALYLFQLYNDEVRGTSNCIPQKTFITENWTDEAKHLCEMESDELEALIKDKGAAEQMELTKDVWKRVTANHTI